MKKFNGVFPVSKMCTIKMKNDIFYTEVILNIVIMQVNILNAWNNAL